MIVKISGQQLAPRHVQQEVEDSQAELERRVELFGQQATAFATGFGLLNMSATAFAASGDLGTKLMPLVHMVQDFALPVGIMVSTWGLIEIMIGNPGGKMKIKMSIIGYCGIFLIPEVFYSIKGAFR